MLFNVNVSAEACILFVEQEERGKMRNMAVVIENNQELWISDSSFQTLFLFFGSIM